MQCPLTHPNPLKSSRTNRNTHARILLVKGFFNDPSNRQMSHPLGIMYVAACLRRDYGYEVNIIDMRVSRYSYQQLEQEIRNFSPHFLGISAQTSETISTEKIASCTKKVDSEIVVILGGPHATAYREKALDSSNIDYVVVGEGEIVTGKLINLLMSGEEVCDLPGLIFRCNGQLINTGRAEAYTSLDDMPFPAYDLITIRKYKNFDRFSRAGSGDYMSIFSSRACPYRCIYCHNIFGKKFRARSAENLYREIKYLHDTYNIREFEILDDIFNLDRSRVLEFCDRIIDSGIKVTLAFPNGLRGDLLNEIQLIKLKNAGTIFIALAIESASPRMQKLIRKNMDIEKVRRSIEIARSLRIHSHGFFMMGFPGETLEEMKMTVDFILSSKLHSFNLFMATPYENTDLGNMARQMGRHTVSDFSQDYFTKEFVNLTDLPDNVINRLRRIALIRFYMNPLRIYGILRDFPGDRSLLRLSSLFLRRIFWKS